MRNNKLILILVMLSGLLFFFKLGSFSLYDAAETIYGEMIKQIRLTGDWITMHYNGEIIFDKPPLYFWLAAAATYIFGFNEFAIRFWAAVCGALSAIATFYLGKSFYNERAGFFSGIIVMTAFQFLVQSRIAEIDILLTLLITLSFLCFWHRRYRIMYLCMALGIITKGIMGAALPGFAIFLFLAFRKELNRLKEMQLPAGIAIVLLIAGPWYFAEWALHGARFTEFVLGFLLLSRFNAAICGHAGPWYYYFLALILGFAPWSHFLPYALIRTWRNAQRTTYNAELLTLCYIIPVFIVFSIAQTKLPNYLLPLYPFLAIMVGKLWDDVLKTDHGPSTIDHRLLKPRMLLSQILLILVVILLIIGFIILGTSNYSGQYQELLPNLKLLAGVLIAGGLLSIVYGLWSKWKLSFAALPLMVFIIALILTTQTLPAIEKYKGAKELGQSIAQNLKEAESVASYNIVNKPGVVFYSPRLTTIIESEDEAVKFLKNKKGCLFTTLSAYEKIKTSLPKNAAILDQKGDLLVLYTP